MKNELTSLLWVALTGALIVWACVFLLEPNPRHWGEALFGYMLFLLDFLAIFFIFKNVFSIASGKANQKLIGGLLVLLGGLKMLLIIAALAFAIFVLKVSIVFFLMGMVGSIVALCVWMWLLATNRIVPSS